MDPEVALSEASNLEEPFVALGHLLDYLHWRAGTGFEPTGGDARAKALGEQLLGQIASRWAMSGRDLSGGDLGAAGALLDLQAHLDSYRIRLDRAREAAARDPGRAPRAWAERHALYQSSMDLLDRLEDLDQTRDRSQEIPRGPGR